MNDAMSGLSASPMPVDQFLWDFPPQPATVPLPTGVPTNLFASMPKTKPEREMYQPFIDLVHKPEKERPFIVFKVPDIDGKPREFITWGCMAHAGSLTGRRTRAYPVYEAATEKLCFLKDTWRAQDLGKEADILRELQDAGVQYIPPFICGGDLPDDHTMTDLYIPDNERETNTEGEQEAGDPPLHPPEDSPVAAKRPRPDGSWGFGSDWRRITQRFHHRFIVDFIGKSLRHVTSSKHLMEVISHAFTVHRQAYENKGKWIHRDISANNILVDANGNGILNDWDLAKRESELTRARRHERTGTWEFMSCLLLSGHHSIHTIQDDMESFVYVVLYHGLRYYPHSEPHSTRLLMRDIFEYKGTRDDGTTVGGMNKKSMFRDGTYLGCNFRFHSQPLDRWRKAAFAGVQEWIDFLDPAMNNMDLAMAMIGRARPPPSSSTAPAHHLLRDHAFMTAIFSHCLSSSDWP